MKEYADNCQACGLEYLSTELTPIKLSGVVFERLRICANCKEFANEVQDFKVAAEIISSTFSENEWSLSRSKIH